MSLSDSERRSFEALEAQLLESDPEFARKINSQTKNGAYSTRKIIVGTMLFIAGIVAMLVGISTDLLIVGVAGFVLMGAGVYFGLTKISHSGTNSPNRVTSSSGKKKSPFMARLEEEWEERRRQEGR